MECGQSFTVAGLPALVLSRNDFDGGLVIHHFWHLIDSKANMIVCF